MHMLRNGARREFLTISIPSGGVMLLVAALALNTGRPWALANTGRTMREKSRNFMRA